MTLAGVIVAGYAFGAVPLVWMLRHLAGVSTRGVPDRDRSGPWRQAAWLAYLAGGWPVFVVATAWRAGEPHQRSDADRSRRPSRTL